MADTNITSKKYTDAELGKKASRVTAAGIENHLAALNVNGDLKDGGLVSQFATSGQGIKADTALQAANIDNTLAQTGEGKVLDARQGKVLADLVAAAASSQRTRGVVLSSAVRDNTVYRLLMEMNVTGVNYQAGDVATINKRPTPALTYDFVIDSLISISDVDESGNLEGALWLNGLPPVIRMRDEQTAPTNAQTEIQAVTGSGVGDIWVTGSQGGTILADIDSPQEGDRAYVQEDETDSGNTWMYIFSEGFWQRTVRLSQAPRDFLTEKIVGDELAADAVTSANILNGTIQDEDVKAGVFSHIAEFASEDFTLSDLASEAHVRIFAGFTGITLDPGYDWAGLQTALKAGTKELYADLYVFAPAQLWYYLHGSADDGSVKLYNMYTGDVIHTFLDSAGVASLTYTAVGFEERLFVADIVSIDVDPEDDFWAAITINTPNEGSIDIDFKDAWQLIVDALASKVEVEQDAELAGQFMMVGEDGFVKPKELSLSAVATSGSYTDLTDKPTLATVATSGSYSDLTNKPAGAIMYYALFPPPNAHIGLGGDISSYASTMSMKAYLSDGSIEDIATGSISSPSADISGLTAALANGMANKIPVFITFTSNVHRVLRYEISSNSLTLQVLSTVGRTGDYNDLLNKPDLTAYAKLNPRVRLTKQRSSTTTTDDKTAGSANANLQVEINHIFASDTGYGDFFGFGLEYSTDLSYNNAIWLRKAGVVRIDAKAVVTGTGGGSFWITATNGSVTWVVDSSYSNALSSTYSYNRVTMPINGEFRYDADTFLRAYIRFTSAPTLWYYIESDTTNNPAIDGTPETIFNLRYL